MTKKDLKNLIMPLMEFNTQNSSSGEFEGYTLPLLKFVQKRLSAKNIKSRIQEYSIERTQNGKTIKSKKRGNLIAFVDKKKPFILLQGHVDTVPDLDNFKPRIKNGYVIGRGAVDMKGSVAGLISAFEELAQKDFLSYSPYLLLTSDEEANNFSGIKHFLRHNKQNFDFGICAEPSNFNIKPYFFGAIYCILEIFGKEAHSSSDKPLDNAIENSIKPLNQLMKFKKFVSLQKAAHFDKSVMNIRVIKGGQKANQIPKQCKIGFTIRNSKNAPLYFKALSKIVLGKIKVNYKLNKIFAYNPLAVKIKKKVKNKLEAAFISNNIPIHYSTMKGFSEATFLNKTGIQTIVFGPGDFELCHINAKKEKINLNKIEKFSKVIIDLFA